MLLPYDPENNNNNNKIKAEIKYSQDINVFNDNNIQHSYCNLMLWKHKGILDLGLPKQTYIK